MNGISGVSGLTGGNCSLEEHRAYQRMEEEMMSERTPTTVQVTYAHTCDACGKPNEDPDDSFCAPCRATIAEAAHTRCLQARGWTKCAKQIAAADRAYDRLARYQKGA